ncbi:MAG: class I SAM-dependent methyltransferase [Pseudanabaenaceae cyanobacterium SKYGB_i_bin29]|nr:class I SAM-dependent methyltransferase [Pseudanabaenaceae cyanobacterium SKYG29]MDW8420916.1 class I SAM-dependent methyltransferase [Pseudanabaenaceae cyanobacterium SKYGB_i_bin29]
MSRSDEGKTSKVDKHIFLTKAELLEIENRIRIGRHVERYALLRQFAKGVVCDAACGCGYGSYLLATNPDVHSVIGIDSDPGVIDFAKREYASSKVSFVQGDLNTWTSDRPIDMLISVETIEHIPETLVLPNFCDRNLINHVILTYPSKKTTHYNPFHFHDFKLQDILNIFSKFICYKHFNWEYEFDVVFLIRESA